MGKKFTHGTCSECGQEVSIGHAMITDGKGGMKHYSSATCRIARLNKKWQEDQEKWDSHCGVLQYKMSSE